MHRRDMTFFHCLLLVEGKILRVFIDLVSIVSTYILCGTGIVSVIIFSPFRILVCGFVHDTL